MKTKEPRRNQPQMIIASSKFLILIPIQVYNCVYFCRPALKKFKCVMKAVRGCSEATRRIVGKAVRRQVDGAGQNSSCSVAVVAEEETSSSSWMGSALVSALESPLLQYLGQSILNSSLLFTFIYYFFIFVTNILL
jgi:hypothetical protein